MRQPERNEDRTPIPDDVARQILETAVEIDKHRAEAEDRGEAPQLTLAELRDAATEAGISKEAFDEAVEKVRAGDVSASSRKSGRRSWLRSAVLWSAAVGGTIGLSAGVITRLPLFGFAALPLALATATAAIVYLAFGHRHGRRLGFVLSGLVLWLYFVAGYVVASPVHGSLLQGFLAVIGGMAAGSFALGAAIVTTPAAIDDDSDGPSFVARK